MDGLVNLLCLVVTLVFWVLVFKHVVIPIFRFGARNPELTKRGFEIGRRMFRK